MQLGRRVWAASCTMIGAGLFLTTTSLAVTGPSWHEPTSIPFAEGESLGVARSGDGIAVLWGSLRVLVSERARVAVGWSRPTVLSGPGVVCEGEVAAGRSGQPVALWALASESFSPLTFPRVPQLWGILGTPRRETAANEGMACCQNGFCLGTRFS